MTFVASRLCAVFAALTLLASTGAQSDAEASSVSESQRSLLDTLLVPIHTAADDPVGGPYGTWAGGRDYKVSLGREVSFFPLLGPTAPRNLPLAWRTTSVRHGEVELVRGDTASLWNDGGFRFEIRHGLVTEAYEVRSDGVEQTFVVHRNIGSGLHDSGDLSHNTSAVYVLSPEGTTASFADVGGTTGFGPGDRALVVYRSDVSATKSQTCTAESCPPRH